MQRRAVNERVGVDDDEALVHVGSLDESTQWIRTREASEEDEEDEEDEEEEEEEEENKDDNDDEDDA